MSQTINPSFAYVNRREIPLSNYPPQSNACSDVYFAYDVSGLNVTSVSVSVSAQTSNSLNEYAWLTIYATPHIGSVGGSTFAGAQSRDYTIRNGSGQVSESFTFVNTYTFGSNTYLYLHLWSDGSNGSYVFASFYQPPSLSVETPGGSGSGSGTGGGTTQQKITITARPGQPSGNSVPFAENTTFTWSISSVPEDYIYQGTQIQFTRASDVTGSNPIFDITVNGLVTQYTYTNSLSPNSDYIWRTKAKLQNYTSVTEDETVNGDVLLYDEYYYSGDSDGAGTVIETPWSEWQTFHTKDYEQVSVTVNLSSPENNASFVHGKSISFRWSISGGSGVTIHSSTIILDGSALTTVQGTGTSYTLSENDARFLGYGSHNWYVSVDCSTDNAGIVLLGSPSSAQSYFMVSAPVATATPSSPSGSTSVKANAPVQFSWNMSKNGDGEYTGSQLEYRYSGQSTWQSLGTTQNNVTTYTYTPGFSSNSVVQWRVRSALNNAYGEWSEAASFTVGDIEIYDARPSLIQPKGTVKGDGDLVFAWTVSSQGWVGGCRAEYSTDGGITWSSLGNYTNENGTYIIRKTAGSLLLPAGSVEWRVSAAGNGAYGDWVQSSFTVSYEAYGRITTDSPLVNSGILKDQRTQFDAALAIVGTTTEEITFSDATFCWKTESGSEYAEEPMAVDGTTANIVFSANKFPAGPLLWYLKAHDSKNNESETEVYASYILKSSIDSFPIKPEVSVYGVSEAITFEWGFIAQNKQLSSLSEIRFSIDGVNWDSPLTIDGEITASEPDAFNSELALTEALYTGVGRYTFPAEYFAAGRVHWQVRSTSSDGVTGSWSVESQFAIRGFPQIKDFSCDNKPFATFSWTANEQTSYEIRIDETLIFGPFHGDEQIFTLPEPLTDGPHTAAIRVQNAISLFSDLVDLNFTVENQPSGDMPLKLRIEAGVDAELFWSPIVISDENEFLVYCDNRLIARLQSDAKSYCDRLTLGEHTYTVYQRLENGNYDIYVHDPVFIHSEVTRLALYDGGPWIELVLTCDQYPTNTFSYSKSIEKTKIVGAKYPVFEIGDFEEATGGYEVCWPYENYSQIDLFKALVGEAIIIKSRGDRIICGVLESCSFDVNSQYIKCEFQLEQMSTDIDLSIAIRPDVNSVFMTNLDKIHFGQMTAAKLGKSVTNPGSTDPQYYEHIADAINELKALIAQLNN